MTNDELLAKIAEVEADRAAVLEQLNDEDKRTMSRPELLRGLALWTNKLQDLQAQLEA